MKFSLFGVTSSLLFGLLMSFAAVQKAHSYELYSNIDQDQFIDIVGINDFVPPSPETDYETLVNEVRVDNEVAFETLTLVDTAATTDGEYTLLLGSNPPTTGPPAHIHTHEDEWYYITEGQYRFVIEDEVLIANPGDLILSPIGEEHSITAIGESLSQMYLVYDPAGLEELFRETTQENLDSSPIDDNLQILEASDRAGLIFTEDTFGSNDTARVPEPSFGVFVASVFGMLLILKRKRKSVNL